MPRSSNPVPPRELIPSTLTSAERTSSELTPSEMAQRTGTTIDTLRYYERQGLIVNVARAGSGHQHRSTVQDRIAELIEALTVIDHTIDVHRAALAEKEGP